MGAWSTSAGNWARTVFNTGTILRPALPAVNRWMTRISERRGSGGPARHGEWVLTGLQAANEELADGQNSDRRHRLRRRNRCDARGADDEAAAVDRCGNRERH